MWDIIIETIPYADILSTPMVVSILFLLFFIFQVFKIFSLAEKPKIYYCQSDDENGIKKILENCPMLDEVYAPPLLGGRSGHLQTASYGLFGRAHCLHLTNVRHAVVMKDGTTVTFDVYQPLCSHADGDFTLAICPGIANSSESGYIRWCVNSAQKAGYRCAVLNHLGAVRSVKLTSSRIFNYGEYSEYAAMLLKLQDLYPQTRFIAVGFSMGANVVSRFLGDQPILEKKIVCGMSICQGYDATKAAPVMHNWESLRRLYLYIMTENIKRLIRHHYDEAVKPHVKSGLVDEQQIWAATSLHTVDDCYTRKIAGFSTVEEYYRWCSSARVLNQINVPMLLLNAADDPLVPECLWYVARDLAEKKTNTLFVLTKHGGHLGFLEGSAFSLHEVTWLDRFIVQFANAAVAVYARKEGESSKPIPEENGASANLCGPATS